MKRLFSVFVLAAAAFAALTARGQMALGSWRDCLDLSVVYSVEVVDHEVYAAGGNGVLRYHYDTKECTTIGRSWGLSDAGVSKMVYDSATASLIIAYHNSNIDILHDGVVYNISDIKRSDYVGDKDVYGIVCHDRKAYLCMGFGIVVVDIERREIYDTYNIGSDGSQVLVYSVAFAGDSIYAATAEGVRRVSVTERHLGISDRWVVDSSFSGYTVTMLTSFNNRIVAAGYTSNLDRKVLLASTDTGYTAIDSGSIHSLRVGGGMLTVSSHEGIARYDSTMCLVDKFTTFSDWADMQAWDAVTLADGSVWAAHKWVGLVCFYPGGCYFAEVNTPHTNDNVYRLVPTPGRMILCAGGHTSTYSNSWIAPTLNVATGRQWTTLDLTNGALNDRFDVVDAGVNPNDTNETLMVCWGYNGGVASVRDNKVVAFYDQTTTGGALQNYTVGSYSTLLVGAMTFDNDGNLWVLNSHSPNALVRRTANGVWSHYSTEALSSQLQVDKLVYDSINGFFWFSGRENMIYVHDGNSRMARVNPNNGSKLTTESVNCMVQDMEGNIWIGTNKGIKVIYDASRAFANGGAGQTSPVSCSNITITNGDFYEYLMAYENVTSIAVDGANRKWVGTASGGVYLLSANGLEQLIHFTVANSPLFSDKIISVAIQPSSGEVYIGTDNGVQVYRSDATAAELKPDAHVYAFPNPVRPGYDGKVAIKGFTRNALVHITDAAGHVVYSTQALGGQATWNLRTADGVRVAAGVYYVFASDAEGGNRSVAKILVMR